jgi:hypothetical protein
MYGGECRASAVARAGIRYLGRRKPRLKGCFFHRAKRKIQQSVIWNPNSYKLYQPAISLIFTIMKTY